jgi:plastocyanin
MRGGVKMNNKYVWVIILLIIIVALGALLLLSNKTNNNPAVGHSTQIMSTTKSYSQTEKIMVTSSGFEPQTITIKRGTRIIWTNKNGVRVTINSDNYPTNLLWPFLNLGAFNNGSSVSVIFEMAGKYTYHNHFNPSQKGTVIVN